MYNPDSNTATVRDANNSSRQAGRMAIRFNELFKEMGLHLDEPPKNPKNERKAPSVVAPHTNTPGHSQAPATNQNDAAAVFATVLAEIHRPPINDLDFWLEDSFSCSEDSLSTISERTEPGSNLELDKAGVELVSKKYEETAL